jgi:hypothetical protein
VIAITSIAAALVLLLVIYRRRDRSPTLDAVIDCASNDYANPGSVRMAERRWRQVNAEKRAAGCPCGKPSEVVQYDHRNLGSVPVETWTCAEHVDVYGWMNNVPNYAHPRPCPYGEDIGTQGRIGQEPHTWVCPHRDHEGAQDVPAWGTPT